jgi:hypothetical protein
MKLPIHIILALTIIIFKINAFVIPFDSFDQSTDTSVMTASSTQHDYRIKLNRNDLNFGKKLIKFELTNENLKCSYELTKLCTKLKINENSECSFNKYKFLPFYITTNKLSTKANKINFESIDMFQLNIAVNCVQTSKDSIDFTDEQIERVNLTLDKFENEIHLTIELKDEILKNLEVNIISASNDYEINFDNISNTYQLLINNTSFLNSNTVLAYVIVNIIDNMNYRLKFQISSNNNDLQLDFDEMKPGLYAIKLKNVFNFTTYRYLIFDYEFFLFINDQPDVIKKFQIKFDGNLLSSEPDMFMTSTDIINSINMDNIDGNFIINSTVSDINSTKLMLKTTGYALNLYNMVVIIVLVTIVLIIVIFFVCICLLFLYLCRKYKNLSNKKEVVKVNSDSKLNQISSISSGSSTNETDTCDSLSSCISAKAISTYNLNQANIRYEKPMKIQQQYHHDHSLSISPITTATTVTNSASSNSSSLLVVANIEQLNNELATHQQYLKIVKSQLNHAQSENYGFYSLKNANILQQEEKIYACNLNNEAQVSSV